MRGRTEAWRPPRRFSPWWCVLVLPIIATIGCAAWYEATDPSACGEVLLAPDSPLASGAIWLVLFPVTVIPVAIGVATRQRPIAILGQTVATIATTAVLVTLTLFALTLENGCFR